MVRRRIKPATKPTKSGLKKKVTYQDSKGKTHNAYYASVSTLKWVRTKASGVPKKASKKRTPRKVVVTDA